MELVNLVEIEYLWQLRCNFAAAAINLKRAAGKVDNRQGISCSAATFVAIE